MKLLILTQIVDSADPSLGFFHQWIEELAGRCEHITVICLKEGKHVLPKNVEVLSLGKEKGTSRFARVLRFYRYMFSRRNSYDAVFVHMNQEYVLMGGLFWKLMGKRVYLWRNHYKGSFLTDLAAAFCTKVFCTSKLSYTARYKKTTLMPVGVALHSADSGIQEERLPHSVLFLARLDESKRPDLLIQALGTLSRQGIAFTATIAGGPTDPQSNYPEQLQAQAKKEAIADRLNFVGAVPSTNTPQYYRAHDIFVNLSRSGMFDKTMFEAAANGCIVLASSRDFAELVPAACIYEEGNADDLVGKLAHLLTLPPDEREALSSVLLKVAQAQSLALLGKVLIERMSA